MFEVNGNLDDENNGLRNFQLFIETIATVWGYFIGYVGIDNMSSIDVYIDNATDDSGYTPIITRIFQKYLTIKLGIKSSDTEGKIAFQFSHELMHFVFYTKYGINKEMADEREESICTAASLIILHNLYQNCFNTYNEHVKNLSNDGYRKGAIIT